MHSDGLCEKAYWDICFGVIGLTEIYQRPDEQSHFFKDFPTVISAVVNFHEEINCYYYWCEMKHFWSILWCMAFRKGKKYLGNNFDCKDVEPIFSLNEDNSIQWSELWFSWNQTAHWKQPSFNRPTFETKHVGGIKLGGQLLVGLAVPENNYFLILKRSGWSRFSSKELKPVSNEMFQVTVKSFAERPCKEFRFFTTFVTVWAK